MAPPSDRHDFPNCKGCPYVNPGQWTICVPCAAEQLSSIKDPCPICAQERRDGHCQNRLCTRPASSRHFEGITAITLHNDPLVDVMRRFKYRGKTGWGMIFARLLIGHLYETWDPADVDLIIANPPSPGRTHTTLVIRHAATYDTADDWPFDDTHDPAIIKMTDTAQSAGKDLRGKQSAALEHGNALVLRHPDRIGGSRVIVYDDICTTGLQLNAVARRLREWGAVSVHGVVLARQPWSEGSN